MSPIRIVVVHGKRTAAIGKALAKAVEGEPSGAQVSLLRMPTDLALVKELHQPSPATSLALIEDPDCTPLALVLLILRRHPEVKAIPRIVVTETLNPLEDRYLLAGGAAGIALIPHEVAGYRRLARSLLRYGGIPIAQSGGRPIIVPSRDPS